MITVEVWCMIKEGATCMRKQLTGILLRHSWNKWWHAVTGVYFSLLYNKAEPDNILRYKLTLFVLKLKYSRKT